ncbi:MAG TPA: hypothetical protein VFF65_12105 [Phycisphaerales bacterium]|nr:hypothetical protein [Phycisphaerales bacterium]
MRREVTFRHPAPFVSTSASDEGVLAAAGAEWFAALLRRIPGLEVKRELCQEDWGVALFARRGAREFWIGLRYWDEGVWHADFHHGSFAWLQRLRASGRGELRRLARDVNTVLAGDATVTDIRWRAADGGTATSPRG